jgi:hypothetical protein
MQCFKNRTGRLNREPDWSDSWIRHAIEPMEPAWTGENRPGWFKCTLGFFLFFWRNALNFLFYFVNALFFFCHKCLFWMKILNVQKILESCHQQGSNWWPLDKSWADSHYAKLVIYEFFYFVFYILHIFLYYY